MALTLASAVPLTSAVGSAGNIRVLSVDSDVVYPTHVELALTVESDTPITSIVLHYQLADHLPVVVAYPEFEVGRMVSAITRIDTDGSAFLPSGVHIQYHYIIGTEDGAVSITDRHGVTFLDPQFDWQSLRVGAVEILWHDRPRAEVEAAAWDTNQAADRIARVLGLDETPPVRAVIFNDRLEAVRGFAPISQAATDTHLYAGFAYGEFDLFLLLGVRQEGLTHETAHLIVEEATKSPIARIPAWFDEGLAMYFEPVATHSSGLVVAAAEAGRLLEITSMEGRPGRPGEVRLFYAQARSLVSFLVARFGEPALTSLFDALSQGEDFDSAFHFAFGADAAQMEHRWRQALGATPENGEAGHPGPQLDLPDYAREASGTPTETDYAPSYRADPGTFGTSLLLALSATFAAAVAGTGWFLRRRRAARSEGDESDGFDPRYDTPP